MAKLIIFLINMVPLKENQRHQGFENVDSSRGHPPPIFNPSDYSTVAWLYPQSTTEITDEFQWKFTVNAVFLTYCLWVRKLRTIEMSFQTPFFTRFIATYLAMTF